MLHNQNQHFKTMKKYFALSLVLTGMLFFCACEKEMIQADPQQADISVLKKAKNHAVPFNARFAQEQTVFEEGPPVYVEMEGLGNASHLGKTNIWVGQLWGGIFPNLEGEAEVVFTAANGDKLKAYLYAFNTIELGEMGPVFATITGSGYFTGGTGRFENASGTYDMTGDFDFLTGESNAFYFGEINY